MHSLPPRPSKLAAALGLAFVLLVGLLAGCGKSAPTHFYTLTGEAPQAAGEGRTCRSLGVGPVDFPAYLDRNQIVTRGGDNQMSVADFNQWIEPLQDNFKRALLADLSGVTCGKPLVLYPWPAGVSPDLQVTIQVRRLDGVLGGEAVLEADWAVLDASGKALAWRSTKLAEASGQDYAQLAAAYSRLVARLAQDIAREVTGR